MRSTGNQRIRVLWGSFDTDLWVESIDVLHEAVASAVGTCVSIYSFPLLLEG
jgi:hypothetical protein